jgi:hypothetical protein
MHEYLDVYMIAFLFLVVVFFAVALVLKIRKIGLRNLMPQKPVEWTKEREQKSAAEIVRRVSMRDRD